MLYEALNTSVLKVIPPTDQRVLDLGCGTGNLGFAIKARGCREVIGITFSADEAKQASQKLDDVLVADLDTLSPGIELGTFDTVVCSHVLEHLRQPHRLLRLMLRHIAPRGRLVVALPNVVHWKQRLRFLRGDFIYTDGGLMDTTHLRFYDWNSAHALLTESGYRVSHAEAEGNLPLPLVRKLLPTSIAKAIDHLGTRRFHGLFGAQFILVGQPEPV